MCRKSGAGVTPSEATMRIPRAHYPARPLSSEPVRDDDSAAPHSWRREARGGHFQRTPCTANRPRLHGATSLHRRPFTARRPEGPRARAKARAKATPSHETEQLPFHELGSGGRPSARTSTAPQALQGANTGSCRSRAPAPRSAAQSAHLGEACDASLSLSDCRVSGAWLPEPHTCAPGLRPWLRARAEGKGKIDGAGR